MIVCQCRNVTDRKIRRLVREGACTTREISRATGAGTRCGGCRSAVTQTLNTAIEQELQSTTAPIFLEMSSSLES